MPGPYKVDMLFDTEFGPGAGWTESWYWNNSSDIQTALTAVEFSNLMLARLRLLTPDYYQLGTRITDVSTPRLQRVNYYTYAVGKGLFPTTPNAGNSAPPFVAHRILLNFSAGRSRTYHLRGLPINVITNTFQYNEGGDPAYDSLLVAWANQTQPFVAPATNLFVVAKKLITPSVFIGIISLTPSGSGRSFSMVVSGNTTPATAIGDLIRVKGVIGADWVNKVWRVTDVSANDPVVGQTTIIVNQHKQAIVGVPNIAFASFCRQGITYPNSNFFSFEGGCVKKTGRPFELLRGRRGVIHG